MCVLAGALDPTGAIGGQYKRRLADLPGRVPAARVPAGGSTARRRGQWQRRYCVMKMELVEKHLKEWGEIIVSTSGGATFELHVGDTEFDKENRLIRLKSANARYVIDGDSIETIMMHFGHRD